MRILLIEDDPTLAQGVSDGLRHSGFEVLAVGTGNESQVVGLWTNQGRDLSAAVAA